MSELTDIDRHWIARLPKAASFSHDPDTQVGCIISEGDRLISDGANRLPLGVEPKAERLQRPGKYDWILHAEVVALHNAARHGNGPRDLFYATLYNTAPLCNNCMAHAAMAGIQRVVMPNRMDYVQTMGKWQGAMQRAEWIAEEAGIEIVNY